FKNSGGKHYHRWEAALEILEKRYAAGEIDEAEFLAMKQNLGK
ncbi:MAG TPA: SHOCT domain-containing protein, partial [Firmicutes bacterium]|nr:SHOCT domain-containing protein [Bacillota bacterium]